MSHSRYTGKEATSHIAGLTVPGWRKVVIAEKGKPATKTFDRTTQEDSGYVEEDDPMGGKGSASATVTIEGYLGVTDKNESGVTGTPEGSTVASLTIHKKAAGDLYTLAGGVLQSFKTSAKIGDNVPFTVTVEHTTSSGAWSTGA